MGDAPIFGTHVELTKAMMFDGSVVYSETTTTNLPCRSPTPKPRGDIDEESGERIVADDDDMSEDYDDDSSSSSAASSESEEDDAMNSPDSACSAQDCMMS